MLNPFTIRCDILQIQSGIYDPLFHHFERGSKFYGAGSSKRMPDVSFQAAYRDLVSEKLAHCLGFLHVPLNGCGCMGIDIVDIPDCYGCLRKCLLHAGHHGIPVRLADMEAACSGTEPGDLSIYPGASLYGPVILLK